jgi:hypothetical protein
MTMPLKIAAVACAVALGAVARGEDDYPVDEVAPANPQVVQGQAPAVDLGANFDANLFSAGGLSTIVNRGAPGQDRAAAGAALRAAFQKQGDDRLAKVDAICELSAAQRGKLKRAIDADVRHLMDDIEPKRLHYQGVKATFNDKEWRQFQHDLQMCQQRVQGLFDAESLWEKALPATLDATQLGRLTAENDARRAYRWRAIVARALVGFDDWLGLDQEQYEALEALLVAKQPRLRLDGPAWRAGSHDAANDTMFVPMVLARVDGEQLRAILNERQQQALRPIITSAAGWREILETRGVIEKGNQ